VSVQDVVVGVLLAVGTLSVLLSCVGVVVMRTALDRLHFTAPAGTIAPVLFAAAVLVEEPLSSAGVKAVIVAVLIVVTTPSLSHATARAARIREHGRFKLVPDDEEGSS
jgi:monovalent cation/proton antiporter MnhG/PhaG subunit